MNRQELKRLTSSLRLSTGLPFQPHFSLLHHQVSLLWEHVRRDSSDATNDLCTHRGAWFSFLQPFSFLYIGAIPSGTSKSIITSLSVPYTTHKMPVCLFIFRSSEFHSVSKLYCILLSTKENSKCFIKTMANIIRSLPYARHSCECLLQFK